MKFERSSGILLHITSLPGRYGIGTLGPEAEDFAELLGKAGMSYWQILPIGPVEASLGYSPYASSSAFAGNWLIISIEKLAEEKWFSGIDIPDPVEDGGFVSFEEVTAIKLPLLASACDGFFSRATAGREGALRDLLPGRGVLARRLRPFYGPGRTDRDGQLA